MTPAETARVLAKAAAFDARTIGEADVLAWHEAIGDLAFADSLEAVTLHYRATGDRLMPADVRDHAKRIRMERIEAAPLCPTCGQSMLGAYHLRWCAGQPSIEGTEEGTEP